MRRYVQLARPQRRPPGARPVRRTAVIARPAIRPGARTTPGNIPPAFAPTSSTAGFRVDPYVDYGRFLTPEGGILIVYKDLDLRLRHKVWRVFAWAASTGLEGWFLLNHSPLESTWVNVLLLIFMATEFPVFTIASSDP
jgi:hypothetical protein